jgi:hypothetical protein
MSDPRYTDPRLSDPRPIDPVLRRSESGGLWGWIAGLAVVALIAFIVIAGWNNTNTASNGAGNNPPITTSSTPTRPVPPSTTGSGGTSPQPLSPPANSGTR